MRKTLLGVTLAMTLVLGGCGYNTFQTTDEQVKASWSEVINQYQRRADLIPNLVNTVKGEAKFEQDTLTKVIEARAKATSIQATPELINDPAAFQKFQQAQGELTGALSRLMVVSENYPNLRANQGFRDLSAQLEGTENRITVARNRYIKSVQDYNVTVRSFPSNLTAMVFGYKEKPNFTVENEKEIAKPPSVELRCCTGQARRAAPQELPSDACQRQGTAARRAAGRCWRWLWLAARRRAGGRATADGACDRPDRHADRGAEGRAGTNADRLRSQQRQPAGGADGASTAPEAIEQYALRVAEQWKLGRKKVDDGAILVVAKNDRALRIEVGYGLEGALNDLTSKRIISETILPRFKQQDFYGGITAGVDADHPRDRRRALARAEPASRAGGGGDVQQYAPMLFILALAVGGVLRAVLGKVPGSLVTGGVVAVHRLVRRRRRCRWR